MVEYADLLKAVQAGQLVAVAPAYNVRGEPLLVIVTGQLPDLHRERMQSSTCEQRARIAVRAVWSCALEHDAVAAEQEGVWPLRWYRRG